MLLACLGLSLNISTAFANFGTETNTDCLKIENTTDELKNDGTIYFTSTGEEKDKYTAVRIYGDSVNVGEANSVYRIVGKGKDYNINGIDFSGSKYNGPYLDPTFISAKGNVNGNWSIELATENMAQGIIIGGDKDENDNQVSSQITIGGAINIGISATSMDGIYINNGAKGTFNENVNIEGNVTSENNNDRSGYVRGLSLQGDNQEVNFAKDLNINLINKVDYASTSYGTYGIYLAGSNNKITVTEDCNIKIDEKYAPLDESGTKYTGIKIDDSDSEASFNNIDITITGKKGAQTGLELKKGTFNIDGNVKIELDNYGNSEKGFNDSKALDLRGTGITINKNGDKTVQIKGYVAATQGTLDGEKALAMKLSNKESYWYGDASDNTNMSLSLSNGAQWHPSCRDTLYQSSTDGNKDYNAGVELEANGGIIDLRDSYSRYFDFQDKMYKTSDYGNLKIKSITGKESIVKLDIDVRTNESDKVYVTDNFSGSHYLDIYQKDGYVPEDSMSEGNGLVLASVKGNGKFSALDREGTLFYTHYNLANKKSENIAYDTDWYLEGIDKIDPDEKPTTTNNVVLSSNALNYHTWRTDNDKLMQRMGELRHNGAKEKGAWFRVKGSKIGRNGSFGFENKYTTYELGYDELSKRTDSMIRYQGISLSYGDGKSSYANGSGDNHNQAISFYSTDIHSKGHYLDLILKFSSLDNDFSVFDTNGSKITGEFNNTGISLSTEYGRKNSLKHNWYIEPQVQCTLGYLDGDNYSISNDVNVSQSGITSALGRLGFNFGRDFGDKESFT